MKLIIECMEALCVASHGGLLLLGEISLKADSTIVEDLAGSLNDLDLDGCTNKTLIEKVGAIDFTNDRCALWSNLKQIHIVETNEGFSHGLARDVALLGDFRFGQLGTGFQT